jgi:DNA-binding NarL/FixJ family response regulator
VAEPISILIVEDKPEFLAQFQQMISAVPDMRVVGTATCVADGLALLQGDPADVLLVDLGLPDGSGLTLIHEVMQRWRDRCDVMVVSVFADEAHVLSAIEAGATGYLLKDSTPDSFVQQIRDLHAGGSPVSPIIARKLLGRLSVPAATAMAKPAIADCIVLAESEKKVLNYAARGYSYDEVAELMGVTRHTVMSYVKRCYQKLQVHSKTEALYEARRMGLVKD